MRSTSILMGTVTGLLVATAALFTARAFAFAAATMLAPPALTGSSGRQTESPLVGLNKPQRLASLHAFGGLDEINQLGPFDAICPTLRLVAVVAADDPAWSFVVVRKGGEPEPRVRRIGQLVGGQTNYLNPQARVIAIERGRVWITEGEHVCAVALGEPLRVRSPAQPSAASPSAPLSYPGIVRLSPSEVQIDRQTRDTLLENALSGARGTFGKVRVVPERDGAGVARIRLLGITPDSVAGAIGLVAGDRVDSLNGYSLADPETLLEAYARLGSAEHLTLQLQRNGRPMELHVVVR